MAATNNISGSSLNEGSRIMANVEMHNIAQTKAPLPREELGYHDIFVHR
ncbi:hypothetical protein WJ968_26315 [Achromobacter xylosoxidans]